MNPFDEHGTCDFCFGVDLEFLGDWCRCCGRNRDAWLKRLSKGDRMKAHGGYFLGDAVVWVLNGAIVVAFGMSLLYALWTSIR